MFRILSLFKILFFFAICTVESNAKWGKGELKFDKQTLEHFLRYLYGAGQEHNNKRSTPLVFAVAEDGRWSSYYFCAYSQCVENTLIQKQAEAACEKGSRGSDCYTFAIKRRIVWKNGNKKVKIKTKDLKSPYLIAKKLQESGFYDGDITKLSGINMKTGKTDDTITITGEKKDLNTTNKYSDSSSDSSDIVEQLESLKKLYVSGVLSEDEFEKAKKKLLGQ
tara:strand:- start:824 stop:1489 length:666 start_codon:yes stop_codon:yes gene_type:complete